MAARQRRPTDLHTLTITEQEKHELKTSLLSLLCVFVSVKGQTASVLFAAVCQGHE